MPQWLERVNFPKLLTVFAVIFGIALGACGLTVLVPGRNLLGLALVELGVMILAAAGVLVVLILWLVAAIFGVRKHDDSDSTRLLDHTDNDDKS
jgi:hypothetical protein